MLLSNSTSSGPLQRLRDRLSDPNDTWSLGAYFTVGVVAAAAMLWIAIGIDDDLAAWPPGVAMALFASGVLTVLSNCGRPRMLRAVCKASVLLTFLVGLKMLATAGSPMPYVPATLELIIYTLFGVLYFPVAYIMSSDMPNTRIQREHGA